MICHQITVMQTIEVVSTVMAPIEGELVLVVVEWSCGSTQLTLKKKKLKHAMCCLRKYYAIVNVEKSHTTFVELSSPSLSYGSPNAIENVSAMSPLTSILVKQNYAQYNRDF